MTEKARYEKKKTRLTKKCQQPPESLIRIFMGIEAWKRLIYFEEMLRERYDVSRGVRFPFGNECGWSFRHLHKKSSLLYVFFEEGGSYCTISINDRGAQEVDSISDGLLPEIQMSWLSRHTCGADGGWLNHSVISDEELPDLIRPVSVKVGPKRIRGKNA